MAKKNLLLALIFFASCPGYCQNTDTSFRKANAQSDINAFIKGHQFENAVDRDVFKKDFELTLSDSSYTLVSFTISWEFENDIYVVPTKGNRVPVTEKNYTLKNIDTGSFVVFEKIIIKKGDILYKAPAFSINTTSASRAEQLRKGLAPCMAYISGYKNNNSASYTIFGKDLSLELSDTSYKIIDFLIAWDRNDGSLSSYRVQGNKILAMHDSRADLSRELRPGATVTIENIRVEKAGTTYKVSPIIMYLK